jgi:protein-disulfide isomerase
MNTRFLAVATALALATACQSQRPAQGGADAKKEDKTPVARFGDTTITASELDDMVKGDLGRMEQQYLQQRYQMRKEALEALVSQKLVEAKAKAQGVTPQELLKREVLDKIAEPTEAEQKQVYDQAKAGGQQLPPYDQVKGEIVRFMKNQKLQPALSAYYQTLKAEAKAEVLLPPYEPPKVEVNATGPSKGPQDAKVTIVEFSDFQCPFCQRAEVTVQKVLATYGDKVRLVYKDYPLPNHPLAPKSAEAAHCAGDQQKYWEMHERLFSTGKLEQADLKQHAKDLGLDAAAFDKCLDSGEKAQVVEANRKAGTEAGVSGTPAFFINGRLISGAQPFEEFKRIIDLELSRS